MVRMSDIAAKAGVSQATVSYVLNQRGADMRICAETRERVLVVAAELGYRRNENARTMVTGRSYNFALMTQGPQDELAIRIMVGAQEVADENGYVMKLFPVTAKMDFRTRIDRCMEQRIAGVLAVNITPEAMRYLNQEAKRFSVPAVLLDDAPPSRDNLRIIADNAMGVRQAMQHLVGLGHRRIAFVSAHLPSPPADAREAFFHEIAAQLGMETRRIETNWHDGVIIERGVRQLFAEPDWKPTALLCAGDKIAMVALRTARRMGLRVPEDVSVVGFANMAMSQYADPPLTTVAQPFEEMGRRAVSYLLEQIGRGVNLPLQDILLPTELIVRESTAAAK